MSYNHLPESLNTTAAATARVAPTLGTGTAITCGSVAASGWAAGDRVPVACEFTNCGHSYEMNIIVNSQFVWIGRK